MSSEIPQWVIDACARWGRAKRRIWRGADWHMRVHIERDANGKSEKVLTRHWHVDGYADSFMGRLMEDKMGAGQGKRSQHWPEVMYGDALEVQRAMPGMPELPSDALHMHFVFDPEWGLTARRKAALIGLKERAYWEALGRAEFWIYARLDPARTQTSETVIEIPQERLQNNSKSATKRAHEITSSEVSLNLSALNRPTIFVRR